MVNPGNGYSYPQSDMKTTSKRKPTGDVVYSGRWTQEEHDKFILGLNKFGRDWKNVASVVKTRSPAQIRSHAQKYFAKLQKSVHSSSGFQGVSSHTNDEREPLNDDRILGTDDGVGISDIASENGSTSPGIVSEVELSALQALISWQSDDGNNGLRVNTGNRGRGSIGGPLHQPQRRHSLEEGRGRTEGKKLHDLHHLQGLVPGSKKRAREHVFGYDGSGGHVSFGPSIAGAYGDSSIRHAASVPPSPNCPLPPSWLKSMIPGFICPPGQLDAFSPIPRATATSRLDNHGGVDTGAGSALNGQPTTTPSGGRQDEIFGFGGCVLPSVSHLLGSSSCMGSSGPRRMSPRMSPRTSAFTVTQSRPCVASAWDDNLNGSAMTTLVGHAESQQHLVNIQEFGATLAGRQRSVSLGEEAQIWFGRKLTAAASGGPNLTSQ